MGIIAEDFSSQQTRHEDDQVRISELEEDQAEQERNFTDDQGSADEESGRNGGAVGGEVEVFQHHEKCTTRRVGKNEEERSVEEMWGWEGPQKQGLYDPALEKDACGVGFIVSIEGRPSHKVPTKTFV